MKIIDALKEMAIKFVDAVAGVKSGPVKVMPWHEAALQGKVGPIRWRS